jgi:hypothetical protein
VLFLSFVLSISTYAQTLNSIKGKVTDKASKTALVDVKISIQDTESYVFSNADGTFLLSDIKNGDYTLQLSKSGFETVYLPVSINNQVVDLGEIALYTAVNQNLDSSVITISEEELTDDEAGGADNVAGLLQSSTDAFQQAVAFNFSQVFFKERGYDSNLSKLLFNGIPMNKYSNGRPQWSEWGGLNDMMRNDEFTMGLHASDKSFGGVLGSTNYITRASKYRKGGQISYAVTNSNYDGRVMATYNTGLMENGFALSVSASRRYAQEGYAEGSAYNANGFFLAVEKVFGDHAINFTGFYTPNRHGKNSPNTQEVFDLGGTNYNAYWGWQEGEKRNSRVKEIKMPTFFLDYNWDLSDKTSLSANLMYQYGTIGDSRLAYGAGSFGQNNPLPGNNPDPTYYKKLPSYLYSQGIFEDALINTQNFLYNKPESQLIWNDLYIANANSVNSGTVYSLYEDVSDDQSTAGNINLKSQLKDNIQFNGAFLYKNTKTEYYARMLDLLGGQFLIDEDKFEYGEATQNDLNTPERKVLVGDKFMYDYNVNTTQMEGFAQGQFNFQKVDFFIAGNLGQTAFQREGLYKNGKFQNTSYGKGEKLNFLTYGVKGGLTYKISGRQLININAGYIEEAPAINNSFSNSRASNIVVPDLKTIKITSSDISYVFRAPGLKARLTGYYTTIEDQTKVSYYFVQGINLNDSDEDAEFLATALTGLNSKNYGGEFGLEWQATPTVTFNGAASVGEYIYDSNPNMNVTIHEATANNSLNQSYLKNFKQSGTPQRGYSLGFTYRDPNFWNVGANANLLTHNYISLSEFRRTDNFYTDPFDGQPIVGLDQAEVDRILAQEKLADVFLVNLVGGKSWKIDDYYIGFFATVNNLFGEKFKTGGFEQSRKANYTELNDDQSLATPLFGNKYWYGRGTSYYINLYFRF